MKRLSIRCATCDRSWSAALAITVHGREHLESCPCPYCGAYTLACAGGEEAEPRKKARKRRAVAAGR